MLHRDAITVTGRTIGEEADAAEETEGQEVVRPLDDPLKETGRPGDPARQPRPRGLRGQGGGIGAAHATPGPARVFDSEEECFAAVKASRASTPATWS